MAALQFGESCALIQNDFLILPSKLFQCSRIFFATNVHLKVHDAKAKCQRIASLVMLSML